MGERRSLAEDHVDERSYNEPRTGRSGRILLFLFIAGALLIGGFFVLGGSVDIDTNGDIEVPEVDVDVNAPEVDVNSEDAPPASADANESDTTSSN